MSIGPTGGIGASAAGSPLSQSQGSERERAAQDATAAERVVKSDKKAEAAAGIGEADGEDHEPADRDADGRRLWEEAPETEEEEASTDPPPPADHKSRDTTGQAGNLLDLSG